MNRGREQAQIYSYAVEFRYEEIPSEVKLDRRATRQLIRELRVVVESRINPPAP